MSWELRPFFPSLPQILSGFFGRHASVLECLRIPPYHRQRRFRSCEISETMRCLSFCAALSSSISSRKLSYVGTSSAGTRCMPSGAFAAFLACGNGSVERLCRPAYHSHEHHGGNCREGNRDRDRRKPNHPILADQSSYVASLTFEEIKQGCGADCRR
mgnify:CR=1 FL=1